MSALQTPADYSQPDTIHCKRCGTILPAHATFCGTCGERIIQKAKGTPDTNDVSERYQIMSLIRHQTYVQIFLAQDNLHNKPVVICDIDISSLDDEKRTEAIKATQREFDLLRRHKTPDVMPVIDLRYFEGHLFTIASWPFPKEPDPETQIHTLLDLLQSDIGLPDEQIAIAWMSRLCIAVNNLHTQLIILGDLDPNTILVSGERYDSLPALMVGWLPLPVRSLLPSETLSAAQQHFTAPEAVSGHVEPGSDIYSLGAILYFLLTGVAPEGPESRTQQALPSPHELQSHISTRLSEITMRALAMETEKRFEDAEEMANALLELSISAKPTAEGDSTSIEQMTTSVDHEATAIEGLEVKKTEAELLSEMIEEEPHEDAEEVTISVAPIQAQLARWYMSKLSAGNLNTSEEVEDKTAEGTLENSQRDAIAQQETVTFSSAYRGDNVVNVEKDLEETATPEALPEPISRPISEVKHENLELPIAQRFKERLSGVLPAMPHRAGLLAVPEKEKPDDQTKGSFLKSLLRFILGEQQRSTTAAALIETPLRIQPNQSYSLRIHLMGRDTPMLQAGTRKGTTAAGLSALTHGEKIHIEVRSSLFQNYAYIVQRADVEIPGRGYAAEVTIPMQALTTGPSGRRERLHIFFTDKDKQPLYEKPFVIELFISHLVQSGREGHNVLNIPI